MCFHSTRRSSFGTDASRFGIRGSHNKLTIKWYQYKNQSRFILFLDKALRHVQECAVIKRCLSLTVDQTSNFDRKIRDIISWYQLEMGDFWTTRFWESCTLFNMRSFLHTPVENTRDFLTNKRTLGDALTFLAQFMQAPSRKS